MQPTRTPAQTQTITELLREEAKSQAGILHRDQLIAGGLSADTILDWAASGRLEKRFRWTYAFPGTGRDLKARAWSAQLSAGGDAAVTSSQALALMELVPELAGPVECTRRDGRPRRQPGLVVHNTSYLPESDVTSTDGLRHTAFPRAVLDYAERATFDQVARALDRGTRLQVFDRRGFDRLLDEYARGAARQALTKALAQLDENTGRKRSELERLLVELVLNSSIPTPAVNFMIGEDEVDIHWIGTRAIAEADGREHHESPADFVRDTEKRLRLEAMGFVLRRFDWAGVNYRPEQTLAEIERFRLANLAPPVPGPPKIWMPGD